MRISPSLFLFLFSSPRMPVSWRTLGSRGNDPPVSSWWSVHPPRGGVSLHCAMSFSTKKRTCGVCWSAWVCVCWLCMCVCVCVCMFVCVCVCSSGTKTTNDNNYTHTHTALNLEEKQNHFSDMSRFNELKHCDGRDDFYHWGVFSFLFLECWHWTPDFTMTRGPIICVCVCVFVCVREEFVSVSEEGQEKTDGG